jgi:hypothetical protein
LGWLRMRARLKGDRRTVEIRLYEIDQLENVVVPASILRLLK